MSIFNLKKSKGVKVHKERALEIPKDMYCCECHRRLGTYIRTGEVDDGTDDIYSVCPQCYDIVMKKLVKGDK